MLAAIGGSLLMGGCGLVAYNSSTIASAVQAFGAAPPVEPQTLEIHPALESKAALKSNTAHAHNVALESHTHGHTAALEAHAHASSQAVGVPWNGQQFMIRTAGKNNICLDDGGARSSGGSKFHVWNCDANNQNQVFVYDAANQMIRNPFKDNLCMDDGGGNGPGQSDFWLTTCNAGNNNQMFVYDPNTKMLRNPTKNNLCMDDGGGNSSGATNYHMWSCDTNNGNQRFELLSLDPAPAPTSQKLPVCLFLHGALVKGARPTQFKSSYGEIAGALRTYWGPFNAWYADMCDSFLYSWANTDAYNWQDSQLQSSYYQKAQEVTNLGGIVIAHSMANAILAGACYMQGKCVQWYSLGGGYSGQVVGNVGLAVLQPLGIPNVIASGFDMMGNGMRLSNNDKNGMAKVVYSKGLLKGSVCGTAPLGNAVNVDSAQNPFKLFDFPTALRVQNKIDQSVIGALFGALGGALADALRVTGETSEFRTDGLVEVATCAFYRPDGVSGDKVWFGGKGAWPEVGPSDNVASPYILASVNHIEETGVFTNTPVIMNWMRNMMCRELAAQGKPCPANPRSYAWPDPAGRLGDACDLFNGCNQGSCCQNAGHGICQNKLNDYLGVLWCPSDCQGAIGQAQTCENEDIRLHWPRCNNEFCIFGTDCAGWGGSGMECCNNKCTQKKRDWADNWWCPSVCKGKWWSNPGTC